MKTYAMTHTGRVRKKNEDRYLVKKITQKSLLLAVADGMGGEVAGDYAAEIIMAKITDTQLSQIENEEHLSRMVKDADRAVRDEVRIDSALEGMGSTITCVLVLDDIFHWVHVGDCRLILVRNRELIQITKDQNMAQFLLEEGQLTAEEARFHPARHQLDQCVGCGDCIPDTGRFEISKGELLLLTTDGLHTELTHDTILSILTTQTDIETKVHSLMMAALDAGGKDNITIVLAER